MMCDCGCGNSAPAYRLWPYRKNFISGHNSRGTLNPMYGKTFSDKTRAQMKTSAYARMESRKKLTGTSLAVHTPDAIKKRAAKQTQKYIDRIEASGNITILSTDRYNGIGYYSVSCNVCNHKFSKFHDNLILCPACNPRTRSSLEDKLFNDLVLRLPNLIIDRNKRTILNNVYELDFYFPEFNVAVEIHGLYYHSELSGKSRNYHLDKFKMCQSKNIRLIQIFEDEFHSYYDIILNKILMSLGCTQYTQVYARDCDIEVISSDLAGTFLDVHHLQKRDVASVRLGMFYKKELVSVMTFSNPNASRGKQVKQIGLYELSRYAVHSKYRILGGAKKLLANFTKLHQPSKIYSYADLRWVNPSENIYKHLNFTLLHQSKPSYWYFKKNSLKRYHRFNFTKKKTIQLGGDPTKTEWENMINLGYDRIWDCGHLKYEMTFKKEA
jgi:hypothetical protein